VFVIVEELLCKVLVKGDFDLFKFQNHDLYYVVTSRRTSFKMSADKCCVAER